MMKKITLRSGVFGILFSFLLLIGCEFETGGDGGFNTALFGWVNFSGVYRATSGSFLVSDFTADTGGASNITDTISVSGEIVGFADFFTSDFAGVLRNRGIVSGSVSITGPGVFLSDTGTGALEGASGSGTINYATGAYTLNFPSEPCCGNITASYTFTRSTTVGGTQSGSSLEIFSLTVFQTGNLLELVDNNGSKYTGQLGNVATTVGTSGADINDPSQPVQPGFGDTAIAEFTAEGISASGVGVMIVGTFQGRVAFFSGENAFLDNRVLNGTWIEANGITGDINGSAAPVEIVFPVN